MLTIYLGIKVQKIATLWLLNFLVGAGFERMRHKRDQLFVCNFIYPNPV